MFCIATNEFRLVFITRHSSMTGTARDYIGYWKEFGIRNSMNWAYKYGAVV